MNKFSLRARIVAAENTLPTMTDLVFRSKGLFSTTIRCFESTEFHGDFEHFFVEFLGIPAVEAQKSELMDEPDQIR